MNSYLRFFPLFFLALSASLAWMPGVQLKSDTYTLDAARSQVVWRAKKVTGEHYGPINFSKGSFSVENNALRSANVEVDMTSITCTDLAGGPMHDRLVGHLKSDDFFSVEKFPGASFVTTGVSAKGDLAYEISGNLIIKGISQPVSFPAKVSFSGNTMTATATVPVDRARYDIKYRSKSFFDDLGDKMIYDEFTLDLKIVATKGGASK